MLSALANLLEPRTLWHPRYWGELSSLVFTQDKKQAQALFHAAVSVRRKKIAQTDWTPWLGQHEFRSLPAAYTSLFLCAYFKKTVSDELLAAVNTQPLPMFVPDGDSLRISRTWMAACEQEFTLHLVDPHLLSVNLLPGDNRDFAYYIHHLHRTTYRLLPLAGLPPTLNNVYRGAVPNNDQLQLRGGLGRQPLVDYVEVKIERDKHLRCCSLTPHACENYDLVPPATTYFVLGRGMEDVGASEACVLPTVLFTTNTKVPSRFKGNAEQLLVLSQDRLKAFFRLFEVPLG